VGISPSFSLVKIFSYKSNGLYVGIFHRRPVKDSDLRLCCHSEYPAVTHQNGFGAQINRRCGLIWQL